MMAIAGAKPLRQDRGGVLCLLFQMQCRCGQTYRSLLLDLDDAAEQLSKCHVD